MLTRRKAIAAGGGALLLAGCGGTKALTRAGDPADLRFLSAALELERAQVALYQAALRAPLSTAQATLARKLLAQEHAHVDALAEAIRELDANPAAPRAANEYTRGLPGAGATASAWLRTAVLHEQGAASAYAHAIPRLANDRLRGTFGAIMTTEAEHATALELAR